MEMLPHAPAAPRRGPTVPRGSRGSSGGGQNLGCAEASAPKEDHARRKRYIKQYALHKVLSDSMTRCLSEMPDDPCLYIAVCLMEQAQLAADSDAAIDAGKWRRLHDEVGVLRNTLKQAADHPPLPPLPPPPPPPPPETPVEAYASDGGDGDDDDAYASCDGATQTSTPQAGTPRAGTPQQQQEQQQQPLLPSEEAEVAAMRLTLARERAGLAAEVLSVCAAHEGMSRACVEELEEVARRCCTEEEATLKVRAVLCLGADVYDNAPMLESINEPASAGATPGRAPPPPKQPQVPGGGRKRSHTAPRAAPCGTDALLCVSPAQSDEQSTVTTPNTCASQMGASESQVRTQVRQANLQCFKTQMTALSSHHLVSFDDVLNFLASSWKGVETMGHAAFDALFYTAFESRHAASFDRFRDADADGRSSRLVRYVAALMADTGCAAAVGEWRAASPKFKAVEWDDFACAAECFVDALCDVNTRAAGLIDQSTYGTWLRLLSAMAKCLYEESRLAEWEEKGAAGSFAATAKRQIASVLGLPVARLVEACDAIECMDIDELHAALAARLRSCSGEHRFDAAHNAAHLASLCTVALCGVRDATLLADTVRLRPWMRRLALTARDRRRLGAFCAAAAGLPEDAVWWADLWAAVCAHVAAEHVESAAALCVRPGQLAALKRGWRQMVRAGLASRLQAALPDGGVGEQLFRGLADCVDNVGDLAAVRAGLQKAVAGDACCGVTLAGAERVLDACGGVMSELLGEVHDAVVWAALWNLLLDACPSSDADDASATRLSSPLPPMRVEDAAACAAEAWAARAAEERVAFCVTLGEGLGLTVPGGGAGLALVIGAFFDAGGDPPAFSEESVSAVRADTRAHAVLRLRTPPDDKLAMEAAKAALLHFPLAEGGERAWTCLARHLPYTAGANVPPPPPSLPLYALPALRAHTRPVARQIADDIRSSGGGGVDGSPATADRAAQLLAEGVGSPRVLGRVLRQARLEPTRLATAVRAAAGALPVDAVAAFEVLAAWLATSPPLPLPNGTFDAMHGMSDVQAYDADATRKLDSGSVVHGVMGQHLDLISASWKRLKVKHCFVPAMWMHFTLGCPAARKTSLIPYKAKMVTDIVSSALAHLCGGSHSEERTRALKQICFRSLYEFGLQPHQVRELLNSAMFVLETYDPGVSEETVEAWRSLAQTVVLPALQHGLLPDWVQTEAISSSLAELNQAEFLDDLVATCEEDRHQKAAAAAARRFDNSEGTGASDDESEAMEGSSSQVMNSPALDAAAAEEIRAVSNLVIACGTVGYSSGIIEALGDTGLCQSADVYDVFQRHFIALMRKYSEWSDEVRIAWAALFDGLATLLQDGSCGRVAGGGAAGTGGGTAAAPSGGSHAREQPAERAPAKSVSSTGELTSELCRAFQHWASLRQVQFVLMTSFHKELVKADARVGTLWGYLSASETVGRYTWLVDLLFLQKTLRESLMHCAAERWKREGMDEDMLRLVPEVLVKTLHMYCPRMSKSTERAWGKLLREGVEIMCHAINTADLTPPTAAEISCIARDRHASVCSKETYYAALRVLDPTFPAEYANAPIDLLLEGIEECQGATTEQLATLEAGDAAMTNRLWAAAQALASTVGGKGARTLEKEVAWRKFFQYRIAPQVLHEVQPRPKALAVAPAAAATTAATTVREENDILRGVYGRFAREYLKSKASVEETFWEMFEADTNCVVRTAAEYTEMLHTVAYHGCPFGMLGKLCCAPDEIESWADDYFLEYCAVFSAEEAGEVVEMLGGAFVATVQKRVPVPSDERAAFEKRFCEATVRLQGEIEASCRRHLADAKHVIKKLQSVVCDARPDTGEPSPLARLLPPDVVWGVREQWEGFDMERYTTALRDNLSARSPTLSACISDELLLRVGHGLVYECLVEQPQQPAFQAVARELLLCGVGKAHFKLLLCAMIDSLLDMQSGEISEKNEEVDDVRGAWVDCVAVVLRTVRDACRARAVPSFRERFAHLVKTMQRVKKEKAGVWGDVAQRLESFVQERVARGGAESAAEGSTVAVVRILNAFQEILLTYSAQGDLEPTIVSLRKEIMDVSDDALIQLGDSLVCLEHGQPLLQIWNQVIALALDLIGDSVALPRKSSWVSPGLSKQLSVSQ